MGPTVIRRGGGEGEGGSEEEVLVTGWQGSSASVTLMTTWIDGADMTERVFSHCAKIHEDVELAALYLDKWRGGCPVRLL